MERLCLRTLCGSASPIVGATELNYPRYMEYLKLIFKKVFGPAWTIFYIITAVAATGADAIWGDNAPVQNIAWGTFAVVSIILLFRLLFLAPYQIWAEDQAKLKALEKPDVDPLKDKRKWLFNASVGLLTSAKKIYHEWSVSDDRERGFLRTGYFDKRSRMTSLADNFLHEEDIYRAAQDAINRCDIVLADATDGLPDNHALEEAHEFSKTLLALLTPDNKI